MRCFLLAPGAALIALSAGTGHAGGSAPLIRDSIVDQNAIIDRLVTPPEKGSLTIIIEPAPADGRPVARPDSPCDGDGAGCDTTVVRPKPVEPGD